MRRTGLVWAFPLFSLLPVPALAQESAALFDVPVVVVGEYSRITNLLDLDGDGLLDAIGTWDSTSPAGQVAVTAFGNDGAGGLGTVWSFNLPLPSSGYPETSTRIATGDFDLDGDEDFAVSVGAALRYYLSNGGLPPTLWGTVNESAFIDEMVAADFDADGRTDLSYLAASLRVRMTGAGGPGGVSAAALPPGTDHQLFVAQVEADGLPDVGVAGFSTGTQVNLYPVSAGGALGGPLAFTLAGETNPMPAAGDVDGDGDADVVVFGMTQYRILRRDGAASFTLEAPVAGGPATDLADVDGDGDLDGVCCGGGGGGASASTNSLASMFEVSINSGGVFAPAFSIPGLGATHIAGAADLDLDGDVDLVGGRCVHYADGAIVGPPTSPGGAVVPERHFLADADRDGDPDLQLGLGTGYRNAADGSFAPSPPLAPAPPAGTTFGDPGWAGDFDGDGDPDLIVEHLSLPAGFLEMRLLRNNGGGGLVDAGYAAPAGLGMRLIPGVPGAIASSGPSGAFPADADGDGDLDLVVRAILSPPASKIWWNDGSGFFTPGPEFLYAYAKTVVDVDGNGLPDLVSVYVTSAQGTGYVAASRNLGGGAFAPQDPSAIFGNAHYTDAFSFADLDGDGDLDAAGIDGSNPVLRANDGTGLFLPAGVLGPPVGSYYYGARRLEVADLDGDGDLDLLASPASYSANGGAQIHRGTAVPFAFEPAVKQMLAPGALADADGDGDLDGIGLAVAKNRRFSGAAAGVRLQYGAGLAGAGGMVPTLGGVGPFRAGSACETRITGGLGGSVGIFALGDQSASIPIVGGTLLTNATFLLGFVLGGTPGAPGEGSLTIPWMAAPSLAGVSFYQQVGVLDPSAPQGFSLSNGLLYRIGP